MGFPEQNVELPRFYAYNPTGTSIENQAVSVFESKEWFLGAAIDPSGTLQVWNSLAKLPTGQFTVTSNPSPALREVYIKYPVGYARFNDGETWVNAFFDYTSLGSVPSASGFNTVNQVVEAIESHLLIGTSGSPRMDRVEAAVDSVSGNLTTHQNTDIDDAHPGILNPSKLPSGVLYDYTIQDIPLGIFDPSGQETLREHFENHPIPYWNDLIEDPTKEISIASFVGGISGQLATRLALDEADLATHEALGINSAHSGILDESNIDSAITRDTELDAVSGYFQGEVDSISGQLVAHEALDIDNAHSGILSESKIDSLLTRDTELESQRVDLSGQLDSHEALDINNAHSGVLDESKIDPIIPRAGQAADLSGQLYNVSGVLQSQIDDHAALDIDNAHSGILDEANIDPFITRDTELEVVRADLSGQLDTHEALNINNAHSGILDESKIDPDITRDTELEGTRADLSGQLYNVSGILQTQIDEIAEVPSSGTVDDYLRGDRTWQTLNTTVVPEGSNLYYTDGRVAAHADVAANTAARHTQNTDTGTTSSTFGIETGASANPQFKNVNGELQVRNKTDVDFADLRVRDLTVEGTTTTLHSEVLTIDDNIVELNSNVSGVPTEEAGIKIQRGLYDDAHLLWDENGDYWKAGISGLEQRLVDISGLYNYTDCMPSAGISGLLHDCTGTNITVKQARDAFDISVGDNVIISGGMATWSSGLTFNVTAAIYYIQGVRYTSAADSITLDDADGTNDRIDVIALDTSGSVVKVTGVAAADPQKPDVETDLQVEVTFVLVKAGSSTPSVTEEDIYLENTEWTTDASDADIDPVSTADPQQGTVSIEFTNADQGDRIDFTSINFDLATFDLIKFYIKSKGAWGNQRIRLFWFNNGSRVSARITVDDGIFGFDSSDTSTWQLITIPIANFNLSSTIIDDLRIDVRGSGGALGCFIDAIQLQTGIPTSAAQNVWVTIETDQGSKSANAASDLLKIVGDGTNLGTIADPNEDKITIVPSGNLKELVDLSSADSNIIVGSAGGWVTESGATVRTSLGLGIVDSPVFTGLDISNQVNISGQLELGDSAGFQMRQGKGVNRILVSDIAGNLTLQDPNTQSFDHGSLDGLNDDDHPQYGLVDGTRDWTGTQNFGAGIGVSGALIGGPNATWKWIPGAGINQVFTSDADGFGTWQATQVAQGADHGQLTGLDDDDHSQYGLVDGTRDWTGTQNFGAGIGVSGAFIGGPSATFKWVPGAGVNQVLTSDADGFGTWQAAQVVDGADHGNLIGLDDDDHSQYAEIANAESISGAWTFSADITITVGNKLELTALSSGDVMLHFNADRDWDFRQLDEDSASILALHSITSDKSFKIDSPAGIVAADFHVHDTASSQWVDLCVGGGDARVDGNTIWHAGNDGAGSGLDADLLDGQQGSFYLPDNGDVSIIDDRALGDLQPDAFVDQAIHFGFTDDITGSPAAWDAVLTVRGWQGSYSTWQLIASSDDNATFTDLYFRTGRIATWGTLQKLWTDANDGSGSGLDADLLDGSEGVAYARLADWETVTGTWTFTGNPKIVNASPTLILSETGVTANNALWYMQANAEILKFSAVNDDGSGATAWIEINRTANVIDRIALIATDIDFEDGASVVRLNVNATDISCKHDFMPWTTNIYDLGSADLRWFALHVAQVTVYADIDPDASGGADIGANGLEFNSIWTRYLNFDADNAYGIQFWAGNNDYSIKMGNPADHQYGPVTDYSIKLTMNTTTGRGITMGVVDVTPVWAIAVLSGDVQQAGDLTVKGEVFEGTLHAINFMLPGVIYSGVNILGSPVLVPFDCVIVGWRVRARDAPSATVTLDVNYNGTTATIFSTKPTIPTGGANSSTTGITTTDLNAGDQLYVDIDTTNTNGADITLQLIVRKDGSHEI